MHALEVQESFRQDLCHCLWSRETLHPGKCAVNALLEITITCKAAIKNPLDAIVRIWKLFAPFKVQFTIAARSQ